MEAIVAVYADWGIGAKGTQPVVLKADRAHFRAVTADAAVLVGRRTLADFPGGKPLKDRHNIVVTRQNIEIEGAEVVHSTEEALAAAARQPRCLVIGGASVYRQFFPWLDKIYLTKIDLTPTSDSARTPCGARKMLRAYADPRIFRPLRKASARFIRHRRREPRFPTQGTRRMRCHACRLYKAARMLSASTSSAPVCELGHLPLKGKALRAVLSLSLFSAIMIIGWQINRGFD